jgi:hypothetical protein
MKAIRKCPKKLGMRFHKWLNNPKVRKKK